MLSSPRTRVRRHGHMPTRMSSEAGDEGGTVEALTGQRRPTEPQGGRRRRGTEPKRHCALVGVQGLASLKVVLLRGREVQEDGDDAVNLLDMFVLAETPSRGWAPSKKPSSSRPWHAREVVTA